MLLMKHLEIKISDVRDEVYDYILERMRFENQRFTGYGKLHPPPAQFVEAFLSQKPDRFYNIGRKNKGLARVL